MARYRKPDRRLDWRDPDMPVMRDYVMPDGSEIHGAVDHVYERGFRAHLMQPGAVRQQHWSMDPTYNLRKRRRRRL